jgi:GH18 family chitinase
MNKLVAYFSIVLSIVFVQIGFGQRIVGYFPDYAYTASNYNSIQYDKLTHLMYFSIAPTRTATGQSDGSLWTGAGNPWFNQSRLNNVKAAARAKNPNIKIFIVAGGDPGSDTDLNARFEYIGSNAGRTNTYANNVVNFIKTNDLDGYDLDWEFPTTASARLAHQNILTKINFKLDSLSTATCRLYEVSIAVGGGYTDRTCWNPAHTQYINAATLDQVDFMNVMTYDGPTTGCGNVTGSKVDYVGVFQKGYNDWHSRYFTIAASKMNMGVAFYDNNSSVYRTFASATNYNNNTWGSKGDACPNLKTKVDYLKSNSIGGIVIWELTQDNLCSGTVPSCYSLLDCIYQQMMVKYTTLWTPPAISGCGGTVTSITDAQATQSLVAYPNPSQSSFNIDVASNINIYDMRGQLLEGNVSAQNFGSQLSQGMYVVEVIETQQRIKIIKK